LNIVVGVSSKEEKLKEEINVVIMSKKEDVKELLPVLEGR